MAGEIRLDEHRVREQPEHRTGIRHHKKRYGVESPFAREYHDCSSGLVEESSNKGNPTVAASRPRIPNSGSSTPFGFHPGEGSIGSQRKLRASNDR